MTAAAPISMRRWQAFFLLFLLPFLVGLTIIGVRMALKGPDLPRADEFIYLELARDLNHYGTFTGGPFHRPPAEIAPGRFFGPAYPFFVHLVSLADPAVAAKIDCLIGQGPSGALEKCTGGVSLYAAQAVLAAMGAWFIFMIAWTLSRSQMVAWLALLIALSTKYFNFYALTFLTENMSYVGLYAFLFFAVKAADSGEARAFAAAGAALAVAALARPSYLYLLYFLTPALIILALAAPGLRERLSLANTGLFAGATLLVLLPWMARNFAHFGDPALSAGYAPFTLAYRVSYNAMSWGEWWASWIFWLPDFGDALARALFVPELYERLGYEGADTYYRLGAEIERETRAVPGGAGAQLRYLLDTHVLNDPLKHMLVTLPLTARGIYAGKYIALAGLALIWPVARLLHREGRLPAYLAMIVPLFFIAGLHGFVSVNVVRYNVPMIALYASTIAILGFRLLNRTGWRASEPHAGSGSQAGRMRDA